MWNLPAYTWDKDRELCVRCKHYEGRYSKANHGRGVLLMVCKLGPEVFGRYGMSCIAMRTEGACGKEARLFEAKQEEDLGVSK